MNEQTEAEFRRSVRQFRDVLGALPETPRADVVTMCGGPEVLEALFEERGVGIGRFAALMGLPATTVRHLLREELLHHVRVNGKFRFLLHNVIELRGVQQWQGLGLTLEDTRAFLDAQGLMGLVAQGGTIRSLEERHAALGAQLERARALERLVQENAFGQPETQAAPA
ncbi:MerR family transcriptional regulator [Deinococcus sp.]|uniref:MerR family transcriptional regulator n=1 Tax=Deinococcus sp. TaxID=47478 RepID=UPI00391B3D6B